MAATPPATPPETPPEGITPNGEGAPVDTSTLDKPLGPEGEKALAAFKERARAAEAEARKVPDLEAQLATLRAEQMTEQEKAIAAARAEADAAARAEVTASTTARLFAAELRAVANSDIPGDKPLRLTDPSLLADPEVALRLLDLDEIPVTETGDIDTEAISAAVARLVQAKPYLAASATPNAGSADQGTRTPPPGAKDLATQIQEAEAAGDWNLAGRLKLQKLAAASPRP